ncbi:MAG: translation initiation factor IF-2, partial [Treponemataceae bacterium]
MAEEFDTTQKPKVTLIKQAKKPDAPETAPQAAPSPTVPSTMAPQSEVDHAERRKVVVVKKKPQPVVVKKPQPRLVAHATSEKPTEVVAPTPVEGVAAPVPTQQVPAPTVENTSPEIKNPMEPKASQSEAPAAAPIPRSPHTSHAPHNSSTASSLPGTQRPAAAAGRVGGRPVGPQRDGEGESRSPGSPFPQRPAVVAGRVGGRPMSGSPRPGYSGGEGQERPEGAPSSGYQGNRPSYGSQ